MNRLLKGRLVCSANRPKLAAMNIALPAELEAFVRSQVQAGSYPTPEAVVRAALSRLRAEEAGDNWVEQDTPELEAMLREGARGPFTPLTDADLEGAVGRAKERRAARG